MGAHGHSSVIHNSQQVDTPKGPLMSEWMNTMWKIHAVKYYLPRKEKNSATCHDIAEPQRRYTEQNEPVTERRVLLTTCTDGIWGGQIHRDTVVPGARGGENEELLNWGLKFSSARRKGFRGWTVVMAALQRECP